MIRARTCGLDLLNDVEQARVALEIGRSLGILGLVLG